MYIINPHIGIAFWNAVKRQFLVITILSCMLDAASAQSLELPPEQCTLLPPVSEGTTPDTSFTSLLTPEVAASEDAPLSIKSRRIGNSPQLWSEANMTGLAGDQDYSLRFNYYRPDHTLKTKLPLIIILAHPNGSTETLTGSYPDKLMKVAVDHGTVHP